MTGAGVAPATLASQSGSHSRSENGVQWRGGGAHLGGLIAGGVGGVAIILLRPVRRGDHVVDGVVLLVPQLHGGHVQLRHDRRAGCGALAQFLMWRVGKVTECKRGGGGKEEAGRKEKGRRIAEVLWFTCGSFIGFKKTCNQYKRSKSTPQFRITRKNTSSFAF